MTELGPLAATWAISTASRKTGFAPIN